MFGSDLSFGGGAPGGEMRDAQMMLVRGQALVNTPRPAGGYALAWHVKAMLMGDLPALAAAVARAPRTGSGPASLSDR